MDRNELKNLLMNKNIPTYVYNLDEVGRDDERLCLRFADGKWNVYFSERGVKTTNLFFDSEDEACKYILHEIESIYCSR